MSRRTILIIDTIILGIIGAAGAQIFNFLLSTANKYFLQDIAGYVAPGLPTEGGTLHQVIGPHALLFVIGVIVVGGLISGFLVYQFAPEAEGHGTDTAVKSFHQQGGNIRARVTPLKIVASAVTIGTGGAAGREGPTALFSAGIGSIYATLLKRPAKEKRLLVLIGMAAGLSAIFRSPIGTAIFAIEVLYSDMEFESEALLYTMLGSIIAYAINGVLSGWEPLFQVPSNLGVHHITDYLWYILLGLASGIIGTILPNFFYGVRDLFHKIPIKPHLRPAIGALGVGLLALYVPQVLGGGYGWIQMAINGQLALTLLATLLFAKMVAFALTVSSGGSGGVFAPALFVGAMLGGLLANVFHQPTAAFVVVGMAAVFGSTARVPIATLLMVTEMTGGYTLLVPAATAVLVGYSVQTILTQPLKYNSLYEAQVMQKPNSPAHMMEHLKTAVQMLGEKRSFDPEAIGHLNFVSLLQSKIPLDLPDGNRLFYATLKKKGKCIGKMIKEDCFFMGKNEGEIAAIIRDDHLIIPHPKTKLEAEDNLLILTSEEKWKSLNEHFINPKKMSGKNSNQQNINS